MEIKYLRHKEIDKESWDSCVRKSPDGLVYACSGYADILCPNWDGIVGGDYEAVLLLPRKRKFGLKYSPHVTHLQQSGIFSSERLSPELIAGFIQAIPNSFLLADIFINAQFSSPYQIKRCQNIVLNLNKPYEDLFARFSKSHRKNTRRAIRNELRFELSSELENVVKMKESVWKNKGVNAGVNQRRQLEKLLRYAQEQQKDSVYSVFNRQGQLSAAGFFLEFKGRYTLFSGTSPEGRKNYASYFLIHEFIKNNAGKNCILDFAGSNIPTVAKWNLGFGGKPEFYYHIRKENALFRMIKNLKCSS